MGRLIDADRLKERWTIASPEPYNTDAAEVLASIEEAPTVDAVEVVRCGKCKNYHAELGWCNLHSHFIGDDGEACHPSESANWKMFNDDDFCSDGERR